VDFGRGFVPGVLKGELCEVEYEFISSVLHSMGEADMRGYIETDYRLGAIGLQFRLLMADGNEGNVVQSVQHENFLEWDTDWRKQTPCSITSLSNADSELTLIKSFFWTSYLYYSSSYLSSSGLSDNILFAPKLGISDGSNTSLTSPYPGQYHAPDTHTI
jgi:hypothetical protein